MSTEEKIKKLLSIPSEFRLYSLVKEERENKTYYRIIAYKYNEGIKRFRVRKAVEPTVLSLWKEFEKERKQKRKLKELIERLDPEKLQAISKELEKIEKEEGSIS